MMNYRMRAHFAKATRLVLLCAAISCCTSSLGRADLVLPRGYQLGIEEDLGVVVRMLQERKLDQARTRLDEIKLRNRELPHREVMLAELLIKAALPVDGRRVLEALAAAEPNRFDVLFLLCRLAVDEQRWFEALSHAQAAEKLALPDEWDMGYKQAAQSDLYLLKGMCYDGRSEWQAAITAYQASLQVESKGNIRATIGLGCALFHNSQPTEALEQFRRLREIDPRADLPETTMAALYDQQGDAVEAENWFRMAIALQVPGAEPARLKFARWLIWNNRPAEVASILSHKPSSPEAERERQFLAAMVARMESRNADAQRLLSTLHQLDPTSFAISNHLALVLIENSDEATRARAQQIAEANVRNNQTSAEAWATLGWIQLKLGDLAFAEQSLQMSCRSGVISRDTAHYLATLQDIKGQTQTAAGIRNSLAEASGPFFYSAPHTP